VNENQFQNNKKLKTIRFMTPFEITCLHCKNKIKKGKKINVFKETVLSKTYFGIKILRFYFRCPTCFKGITLKTDPKNFSYLAEINCNKV
jgi:Zn finger protein HypA/HybF involved in hydrogenase expression